MCSHCVMQEGFLGAPTKPAGILVCRLPLASQGGVYFALCALTLHTCAAEYQAFGIARANRSIWRGTRRKLPDSSCKGQVTQHHCRRSISAAGFSDQHSCLNSSPFQFLMSSCESFDSLTIHIFSGVLDIYELYSSIQGYIYHASTHFFAGSCL